MFAAYINILPGVYVLEQKQLLNCFCKAYVLKIKRLVKRP